MPMLLGHVAWRYVGASRVLRRCVACVTSVRRVCGVAWRGVTSVRRVCYVGASGVPRKTKHLLGHTFVVLSIKLTTCTHNILPQAFAYKHLEPFIHQVLLELQNTMVLCGIKLR